MSETDLHTLPDSTQSSGISYDQLMKKAEADAAIAAKNGTKPTVILGRPEHYQPVDQQEGLEAADYSRNATELFRDEVVPTLPIGKLTRTALEYRLGQVLGRRGGIFVRQGGDAAHHPEHLLRGLGEPESVGSAVELGLDLIKEIAETIEEAAGKIGLHLEPQQLLQLSHNLLVWHELAHALQRGYETAAAQTGDNERFPTSYPPFGLKMGEATFPNATNKHQQEANLKAEKEGFAEGLAQKALTDYVTRQYHLSPTQADEFYRSLTPQEHVDARDTVIEILELSQNLHLDEEAVLSELHNAGFPKNRTLNNIYGYIGYGSPQPPDRIEARMRAMP